MANEDWAIALAEADDPKLRDAGLWARCFAESDGDEGKAKAAYVKTKVGHSSQQAAAAAPFRRTGRGWCPICHAELDIDALHCVSCSYRFSERGLKPLADKPMKPVSVGSDRQIVKTAKSRGIYIILGIFFGLLGIHNFYAGRYGVGAIQLLITGILGWFVVGLFITAFWVIYELFTVKADGSGDLMS